MVSAAGVREAGEVLSDRNDHVSKAGLHAQNGDLGSCRFATLNMSLATTACGSHVTPHNPVVEVFRQEFAEPPSRDRMEVEG